MLEPIQPGALVTKFDSFYLVKSEKVVILSSLTGLFMGLLGCITFWLTFSDMDIERTGFLDKIVYLVLLVILAVSDPILYFFSWLDGLGPNRIVISDGLYLASPLISGMLWSVTSYLFLWLFWGRNNKSNQ